MSFANSLNFINQVRQNVRLDLEPNCSTLVVFLKICLKKAFLEKKNKSADDKKHLKEIEKQ